MANDVQIIGPILTRILQYVLSNVLELLGIQISLNATPGLRFLSSVTGNIDLYTDGTNLIFAKAGTPWITVYMSGSTPSIGSAGTQYDYYGPNHSTTAPRTQHAGTWYANSNKASTNDWEHFIFRLLQTRTSESEILLAFRNYVDTGGGAGLMALTSRGAIARWMQNKGAGAAAQGTVVDRNTGAAQSFVACSAAASTKVKGVVLSSSIAVDGWGWVVVEGPVKTLTTGAVAFGDRIETSATAGKGQATGAPTAFAVLGVADTADAGGAAGYVTCCVGEGK